MFNKIFFIIGHKELQNFSFCPYRFNKLISFDKINKTDTCFPKNYFIYNRFFLPNPNITTFSLKLTRFSRDVSQAMNSNSSIKYQTLYTSLSKTLDTISKAFFRLKVIRCSKALLLVSIFGLSVFSFAFSEDEHSIIKYHQKLKKKSESYLHKLSDNFENLTSKFDNLLDKYVPLSQTVLLPDVKDLNYPDNLPTLVVDLDKVLVKMEYDKKKGWRVLKRPGADEFFRQLVYYYEIVIWSDDVFPVAQEVCSKWAVPIIGTLNREQCKFKKNHCIKDLSRLGRNLNRTIIVDHDNFAFLLQPKNGILVSEYTGDPNDNELYGIINFLKMAASSQMNDLRQVIESCGGGDVNIGKRWTIYQNQQEKKSESRRLLASNLFRSFTTASDKLRDKYL